MGEATRRRHCLDHLLRLTAQIAVIERRTLEAELDRVLACSGRLACASHLACSWLAAELARGLMHRYR